MASLTPEVIHALVQLARGELDMSERPKEDLYELAAALINARESLAQVLTELNDRGDNFAKIGETLGIHEATAARWAKPPTEDRRRRRRGGPSE